MPNNVTRRSLMATSLAFAGLMGLATPALALSDAEARALVDKVVKDINSVISSGKSVSGMIKDFEKIFVRYGDVNIIARSALGVDSRRATSKQMADFTVAFRGYISRKYGKRFNEFVGGNVTVTDVRRLKSYVEVRGSIKLRGQAPFDVSWLVSDKSGKDLFFDMIMEGISLRLTEATEIGAMLDRRKGDINALISDLRKAG
jgi:phospholipid transport system substrate-binding protein